MGARQSRRSVDITTTPKKGDGEVAAVGEEKIEKLCDADVKAVVTNGTAAHTDIEFADKDEEAKETDEQHSAEVKENGLPETSTGDKTPDKEAGTPAAGDQLAKVDEESTEKTPENQKVAETPDPKKQKEKKKKKWSLRSISFSKKDKSKPSKDKEKNGEVEEVNEEKTEEAATSPTTEPAKADDAQASVEEAVTPATNGDASKEELAEKVSETTPEVATENIPTSDEPASVVETPKDEPKTESEPATAKVEESVKPVTDEQKPIEKESPVVEEVKEVRSVEVPPPLPSSNPPSQVTVFAESMKDNVLSIDDASASDSPVAEPHKNVCESPSVAEPVEPHKTVCESPSVAESAVSVESERIDPVESEVVAVAASLPLETNAPPHVEEAPPVLPSVESISIVESSDSQPEIDVVQDDTNNLEPTPKSSPLIVEAQAKESEDSVQDLQSKPSGDTFLNSLVQNDFEGPNLLLAEPKKSNETESTISLPTEAENSVVSVGPVMIEENIPIVSSAGDVPNHLVSQSSLDSKENSFEELKSNLNLKDSPTSQAPSVISEEKSEDLSTIPEVASSDLEFEGEKVGSLPEIPSVSADINELSASPNLILDSNKTSNDLIAAESSPTLLQKDIEPVCNADSLPDLSTESLPSLPEPTDSLLEPMSLPPLDSVPDPLVDDNIAVSPANVESPTNNPIETEPPVVLTNGNATNGLISSPNADDDDSPPPPPLDGPLKQIANSELGTEEAKSENSQSTEDTPGATAESAPVAE